MMTIPTTTSSEDDFDESRKKKKTDRFENEKSRKKDKKRRRTSSGTNSERLKRSRLVINECDQIRLCSPGNERTKGHFLSENSGKSRNRENDFIEEIPKSKDQEIKRWINDLPQEILLKIFGYLSFGSLVHTIPQVCKKWENLSLDWSLWKTVENLTIKNMVISTVKLKTLLRTIPNLKKLELILRNDTEELLGELFETNQKLEMLKLDRCYRSTLQMSILSRTVTSILDCCPNLKTVVLTDTYFHSKNFYKILAKKFKNMERINVTCTTKSEMDVFMENLTENVPEVEFQRVPMMGKADGKQIYWGPILGLVVRPIPTSPYHRQGAHNQYPNYAF